MNELQTVLKDRVLRFDGVTIVTPESVCDYFLMGISPKLIKVSHRNDDVDLYNSLVSDENKVEVAKKDPIKMNMEWQLDDNYLNLDLVEYFGDVFAKRLENDLEYSNDEINKCLDRITSELHEVNVRGMTRFMQTLIFVIDTFKKNNVVWGVGRGSSCASYLLFLLNVHLVDCIKYDIPQDEFFHD